MVRASPAAAVVQKEVVASVRRCDPGPKGSLDTARSCLEKRLLVVVSDLRRTSTGLPLIDAAVANSGGFVADNCHAMMHWVGRHFALARGITLASLQRFLPSTNDPSCSAGFAHGLISALGKAVLAIGPKSAAALCARSPTRYQQYSCVHGLGHAYMRVYFEHLQPALRLCKRLPRNDVADCAQGAFHDFWFSTRGFDDTHRNRAVSPRALCGPQPREFVRPCWYRAFMEVPPLRKIRQPHDLLVVCAGLRALQHQACVTAASAVAAPDPFRQLAGCARLSGPDAGACVRGVSVQNLLGSPPSEQERLIQGCGQFRSEREACIAWIAKTLNVVTNGDFAPGGCDLLLSEDRATCRRGAASWRGALETFS